MNGPGNGRLTSTMTARRRVRIPAAMLALTGAALVLITAALPALAGDGLQLISIDRSPGILETARLLPFRVAGGIVGILLLGTGAWLALAEPPGLIIALLDDAAAFRGQIRASLLDAFGGDGRMDRAALGVLLVFALLVRAPLLALPLGYDESITYVYFASRTLIDIVSDYAIPNNQVLHTILVHLSVGLLGDSPVAVRLPALLAGLLTVPATYWLAARLFGRPPALLAAAIVAVSPPLVEYSAQARGYTILALLLVLAFIVATVLRERATISGWLAFAVLFSLGFYTVPTMALGYGVTCGWLVLTAPPGRRLRLFGELTAATTLMIGLVALLYAPIVARSGWNALLHNQYVQALPWPLLLRLIERNAATLAACWSSPAPLVLGPLLGAGMLAAIANARHSRSSRALFLALGWIPLIVVLRRVAPPPRTLHMLLPLVAGLTAWGLWTLFQAFRKRKTGRGWTVAVLGLSAVWAAGQHVARAALVGDGGLVPGALGTTFCSEPYFVDGAALVRQLRTDLDRGDLFVAEERSGIIESVQYEMLRAGLPPTLAYSHERGSPAGPLQKVNGFHVALNRNHFGGETVPADVIALFGSDQAAFVNIFETPGLVSRLGISDLYRVERRVPLEREAAGVSRMHYPR